MKIIVTFFILFANLQIYAQGTPGTNAKYEYRSLIDMPTAGILEKGYVGVTVDVIPVGVVSSKIEVGVFENFSFGISYGGSNIIGTGRIDWYKLPGVNLRYRIIDETTSLPAIAVGFDSQGKGDYVDSLDRFEIKSPGFFAAAAKNFEFLGYLSVHGVINYSLENKDKDRDPNLRIGLEKTLGSSASFVIEYDLGFNDNDSQALGEENGYLNMGFRMSFGDGFTFGVDLRNLLHNKKFNSNGADRAIFVEYIKAIF